MVLGIVSQTQGQRRTSAASGEAKRRFFFFFFISEVSTGCNYLRLPSGKCQSSEMSKRRFSAHALP